MLEQDAFRVSSEDPERGAILVFGIMSLYKAMTSSGGPGRGGAVVERELRIDFFISTLIELAFLHVPLIKSGSTKSLFIGSCQRVFTSFFNT